MGRVIDRRRSVGVSDRSSAWSGLSALERERVRLVVERVVAGESVVDVAHELGLSESEVESLLRLGLDGFVGRLSEYVEERLRLHLMRLDRLFQAVYPRALEGDVGAVKRALEILHRESMVLGLDAAQKRVVEHRLTVGERAGQMIFGESGSESVAALPDWYIDAEIVSESDQEVGSDGVSCEAGVAEGSVARVGS